MRSWQNMVILLPDDKIIAPNFLKMQATMLRGMLFQMQNPSLFSAIQIVRLGIANTGI